MKVNGISHAHSQTRPDEMAVASMQRHNSSKRHFGAKDFRALPTRDSPIRALLPGWANPLKTVATAALTWLLAYIRIPSVFSGVLSSFAVINTMTTSSLGRARFIWLAWYSPLSREPRARAQNRNLEVGAEAETLRNTAYWFASIDLLSLLSDTTQDHHLLRSGTSHITH